MPILTIRHVHQFDEATSAELRQLIRFARAILENTEIIMIDTTKLLEAVERQKTESASLRELARGQTTALKEIKAKLDEAVAKLENQGADTAALEKVQQDVDKATADLDMDNADVQEVLEANVQPTPSTPPASGGGDTGGGPQPLPGTGVEPPAAPPADAPQVSPPVEEPKNPS